MKAAVQGSRRVFVVCHRHGPEETRAECPSWHGGYRRKLLEMEEEGAGMFGAPVWEEMDTIWQP